MVTHGAWLKECNRYIRSISGAELDNPTRPQNTSLWIYTFTMNSEGAITLLDSIENEHSHLNPETKEQKGGDF